MNNPVHSEFIRRRYVSGKRHDSKMNRLAWTVIGYAVAVALLIYTLSK